MMECLEPRFVNIQESGYSDHIEFLERNCPTVLVFENGIAINILWNSERDDKTKQRELCCHETSDYEGQGEE